MGRIMRSDKWKKSLNTQAAFRRAGWNGEEKMRNMLCVIWQPLMHAFAIRTQCVRLYRIARHRALQTFVC